jgi:isopenicillin-N epimerase
VRTGSTWRLDRSVTFLNHGSYGACPAPVIEAEGRWRERLERQPVRFLSRELEGLADEARRRVAAFLGADPDGLAFVPNATTGVSTVLRSLAFQPGDELLTTDHEYNATLNALAQIAERDGATVVRAAIPFPIAHADDAVEAVAAAVTPRTRFALLSHITSPTALVLPIERIAAELADRGVDVLVDGAHAPGMVPVDLGALDVPYWTGNGHKWLCGPKGSAVLSVRADHRGAIQPLVISHGWNDPRAHAGERTPFRLRFDWTGTSDPAAFLALADAVELVPELEPGGWPAVMAANHALVLDGRDRIAAALGVAPPAPDDMLGSMAALPVPGLASDAEALALHLALVDDGIEVPVHGWPVPAARGPGHGPRAVLLRISAQRYNEASDYDRLADALRRRLGRPGAR